MPKKFFKNIFPKKPRHCFFTEQNRGFTIIETLIAVAVLTAGIVGTYFFISHFTRHTSISKDRLTASYLALEGTEIVKNIRDSNWLRGSLWNSGLSEDSWEADYTETTSLSDTYDGDYLNLDSDGFYGYGAGTTTKFKREIEICTSTGDIIYASSTVRWSERGRSRHITVEEKLYNWYE